MRPHGDRLSERLWRALLSWKQGVAIFYRNAALQQISSGVLAKLTGTGCGVVALDPEVIILPRRPKVVLAGGDVNGHDATLLLHEYLLIVKKVRRPAGDENDGRCHQCRRPLIHLRADDEQGQGCKPYDQYPVGVCNHDESPSFSGAGTLSQP